MPVRSLSTLSAAIVCILLNSASAVAQTPERSVPAGIVTGHVTCADTQRPARLARVSLVPAAVKAEPSGQHGDDTDTTGANMTGDAVETSLDGSYTLRNVRAGEYYLVVDKEGYELPLAEFTTAELAKPDEAIRQRMAARLHIIRVVAQSSIEEDVVLERGASVEGVVTYDDGSPAAELQMHLLMKNAAGRWEQGIQGRYRNSFGLVRTNDLGHYRITGLPSGEYALESDLSLEEFFTTTSKLPSNNLGEPQLTTIHMARTRFNLPLFSGNVWRKPLAESFTLGSAEQRTGMNLEFPLSKLHKASGQVVAKDGHALNGGKLELLYADDKSKVTEADIDTNEARFQLDFVPEGEFTLKGSGMRDVALVQVPNPPGSTPKTHEETRTLRTYGTAEQPLLLHGDVSDIVMTVPDAKQTVTDTKSATN